MDVFSIELGTLLGQAVAVFSIAVLTWLGVLLRRLCRAIELMGHDDRAIHPPIVQVPDFIDDPAQRELMIQLSEPLDNTRPSALQSKADLLAAHLAKLRRTGQ